MRETCLVIINNQFQIITIMIRKKIKVTCTRVSVIFLMVFIFLIACNSNIESFKDWKVYGGSKHRIQYSTLNQIDTNNVKDLQVAWVYNTNDAEGSSKIE